MNLTIVYITFRLRPRFEWFAASLARELPGWLGVQVLVIDGRLWHDEKARREEFNAIVAGRFAFEHTPPKATVWQGPHRLTSKDYFAAANTRNTAFALARGEHVIFVDDLSVLRPGWFQRHHKAAIDGYVLSGVIDKVKNLEVDTNGNVVRFDPHPPGVDSRRAILKGDGLKPSYASWLFGGTFSVPLEAALQVNGQDEICDIIGGEDYDMGIRLERAGARLMIDSGCATYEDEDGHHTEAPMVRLDKPWAGADGPFVSNLLYNRAVREKDRIGTLGNLFDLRELRARVLRGEPFPAPTGPTNYFSDGQPLSEM